MKCGVVDVGGGLRGIYAAGVLDRCMDDGVRFDVGIGVSAGSANMASYAAGQRGRNYRFFAEYAFRGRYMGVGKAQRLAAEGKVLIVAPDDTCGVDTLKRDRAALDRLYEKGLHDGGAVKRFLQDAR